MNVQAPDGKVIEFPDAMSADQVGEAMRKQYPPAAPKAEAPKAPANQPYEVPRHIPDPFQVVGKIGDTLAKPLTGLFRKAGEFDVAAGRKTPDVAEKRAQQYGRFGTELAEGAAMPWTKAAGLTGMVGRTLQSGLLGGLQAATPDKDSASKAVKGGLAGLLGGVAGEALTYPLKFIKMAGAARRQAADKAAFDKSMTETLNQMATQGHEKEVSALRSQWEREVARHEQAIEKSAGDIVTDFKKLVPSWAGLPSGVKGLQDMVVGQGQDLLSKTFDKAMKGVIETGSGKKIALPRTDIEALGLKTKEFMDGPAGPLTIGVVDAGQAASAAVGKWSKEPGAYRRIVGALDKAGIGDQAARQEYKAGQALINFVDKSDALKGDKFNPEALVRGMNRVKVVDELRRRGMGDVFRGPMQAARGVPGAAPKPPVLPKAPSPLDVPKPGPTEGVKTMKNPIAGHPWAGAALAEMAASAAGHHGFGGPAALGYLGASALPKELVTKAPMTHKELEELARAAGLTGTGVRSGINALLFPPR